MQPLDLQSLNETFAITNQVAFAAGPGGLAFAEVRNRHASATISTYGAQILSFQPHDQQPVLWRSAHSYYQQGKAIRGGVPICWPWFGPHPTDPSKPSHGFARTAAWRVLATAALADGATQIRLRLRDSEATYELWPHSFDVRAVITVGPQLRVELIARNYGDTPYTFGGALHSYFAVADVGAISIRGLEDHEYIDQLDGQRKTQHGPITIAGETDRVYLASTETCVIDDPGMARRISIAKSGSRSTVVWNPWIEKAQRLADFGDDEYREMVCIETANALDDSVTVAPGGEHRLVAMIGVES
ncbi:MAG TPA: D-hexose-6-phosphate mutarotase [Roseiflexaceae bacterium]|nr:D-hexose-6-phosphate mutarotase [Roseiflexaceae bacterium]